MQLATFFAFRSKHCGKRRFQAMQPFVQPSLWMVTLPPSFLFHSFSRNGDWLTILTIFSIANGFRGSLHYCAAKIVEKKHRVGNVTRTLSKNLAFFLFCRKSVKRLPECVKSGMWHVASATCGNVAKERFLILYYIYIKIYI